MFKPVMSVCLNLRISILYNIRIFVNFHRIHLSTDSAWVPVDGPPQGTLLLIRTAGGVLVRIPQVRESRGLHAAVVLRTLD